VPSQVALAISQSNASRNVYLGGPDEGTTEEQLRDDLNRFGLIDQVEIVRDKKYPIPIVQYYNTYFSPSKRLTNLYTVTMR
jgi:RNA recognition motif-containing protein